MIIKKSIFFILFLTTFLTFIISVESFGSRNSGGNHNKILLNDVQTLTLKSGEYTKAKRTTPIKQMECNGGTAQKEYQLYPNTIQCYNMGSNGNDVQWKCEANLDTSLKLGKIDVSCEGYSYPDDPYITAGSCGVFYELEYSDPVRRKQALADDESSWFTIFIVLAFIAFIFFAIYNSGSSSSNDSYSNAYSNTASDNNYPGGYPGYNGGPTAPPPQNNNNNQGYQGYPNINPGYGAAPGCNNNNNAGGGGWFPWIAGTGLGYLWGRNSGRNYHNHYTPSYSSPRSSSYSTRSSSSGGGSGFSSSSSSYSGTSRR